MTGRERRRARRGAVLALVLAQLVAVVAVVGLDVRRAVAAPGPPPLLTFYVPLAENDYLTALRNGTGLPASIGTTAFTTISLTAAAAGTIIYYDHWENGYEATINDRTQITGAAATLVWGDGDLTNGDVTPFCTPSCTGDIIPAGGVVTLNNSRRPGTTDPVSAVPSGIPLSGSPLARDPAQVYWDGRDKLASTRGLAVANVGWGEADALASGAVSAYDTTRFGTSFVVPIGPDSPLPVPNSTPAEYTGVSVMAAQDDTLVEIDTNANGVLTDPVDVITTLDQGETVLVDGGLLQGATINTSQPVQADLYVADIGANYEISFIELFPTNQFSTAYLASAGSPVANQATVVYLFNPYPALLTITVQTSSGSTPYSVPGRTARPVVLNTPLGSAGLLTAPLPFTAVALVGANAPDTTSGNRTQDFDWGYAPLPVDFLTPAVSVGWAPAWQPGFAPDLNASPVWVTATSATTLYVDFDGDPTTGLSVTPHTGPCDGIARYDAAIPISALQSRRITDTTADGSPYNDGIMTGAKIFTCDGTVIAASYGEDPANAPVAQPGLDLGTAILPAAIMVAGKDWELVGDRNGDGRVDPGDTVAWEVSVSDAGATALTNTVLDDPLPAGVTYVAGSTTLDTGWGPTPVPDHGVPPYTTPYPLDEGGLHLGTLAPGSTVRVRFLVTINEPLDTLDGRVRNRVTVTSDQAQAVATSDLPVQRPSLDLVKTSNAAGPLGPGDPLTYTITVTNNGTSVLAPVTVTDSFPAELDWLSTTVHRFDSVTAGTIADDLQCSTYSCSTGSMPWAAISWQEEGDLTTPPIYSTGGIQNVADPSVTTRAIRMGCTTTGCTTGGAGRSISRVAGNFTSYERASLSVGIRCSGIDPTGDSVALEIRPDASALWQTLQTFDSGCNSSSYVTHTFQLDPAAVFGTAVEIRFIITQSLEQNDLFYADNITFTLADRVPVTFPGGAPPSLTTLPDLLPGETATIIVTATVKNPLPPGTLDIVNTATATSGPLSDTDDHTDCVVCFDFGDAPEDYGTTYASDGARARYSLSGPRLGALIDREADAYAAVSRTTPAVGDDTHDLDDEDGVVINGGSGIAGGTTMTIDLTVTGVPAGGWVNGWFDFDNDGEFDTNESIFHPSRFVSASTGLSPLGYVTGPGTYTVTVNVPDFGTNGSGYAIGDLIYSRFRISSVAGGVAESVGQSIDGEVEDFSTALTALPVELAWFSSKRTASGVLVRWRTSQEIDTLGFNVYAGRGPGEYERLTSQLVPSEEPTSTSSQSYKVVVTTDATDLWLEAVDLDGTTHLHGPFRVGGEWGDPKPPAPVDWAATSQALAAATPAPPVVRVTPNTTGVVASVEVPIEGLYRITAADLAAAGVDLTGVAKSKLALTVGGRPVAVKVDGKGTTVGPDTVLTFWGAPVDTLYTGVATYQLQLDRKLALRIGTDRTDVPDGPAVPSYVATVKVEQQRSYSVTAPGSDPWYDQLLSARGRPRSVSRTVEVSAPATGQGDAVLAVGLWGLSRMPVPNEHHVRIALNGRLLTDTYFDDAEAPTLEMAVPDGLLVEGANEVTVTLVGDTGVPLDMVALDRIELRYPRSTAGGAQALRLRTVPGRVEVSGLPDPAATVVRFDDQGQPALLAKARIVADPSAPGTYKAVAPGGLDLAVVPATAVRTPAISAARRPADLLRGPADYLVITHAGLTSSLEPLVQFHQSQGRRVKVVDVADIYQAYGYGMVDAKAIDTYVAEAKRALGVRWVLLAGADNYDYRDFDRDGSFSLVPSPYGPVGLGGVNFAPLDAAYADVDGDGIPDLALGRLPARTPQEMQAMVAKTVAYASSAGARRSALLVSDQVDGFDLAGLNDELAGRLSGWTITRADIARGGVSSARQALLGGLAQGPALTSYIGHSGVRELGPAGFFASRDVTATGPAGAPTAAVLYGCWNAYYVLPSADTLAHRLLTQSGSGGAAAVLGAVTLTSATSDVIFARLMTDRLAAGGSTFGEAVLSAKRGLASSQRGLAEIQLGWTMLGDPALPVPGTGGLR
ncbi:C25 family cysteine peptidase [Rhabdothermincola sp.]|uniref:C25 family cysteine peptidase n=1 Tax=Rhabdothermincola sp. TaxID=2820405 RepID=UPI002FE0FBAA